MRPERAGAGGTVAQDEANPISVAPGPYFAVPAIMRRIRQVTGVGGVDPNQFNRIVTDGMGRPAVGPDIQTYERPFDKEAADYFTGEHALIRRPIGNRAGVQEGVGLPSPVVYRPSPVPWFCGTVITPDTPAPSPLKPVIVDDSGAGFTPADVRSRLGI